MDRRSRLGPGAGGQINAPQAAAILVPSERLAGGAQIGHHMPTAPIDAVGVIIDEVRAIAWWALARLVVDAEDWGDRHGFAPGAGGICQGLSP